MSSTPSLKHNDAKEHDSFLIIISNFFFSFFYLLVGAHFRAWLCLDSFSFGFLSQLFNNTSVCTPFALIIIIFSIRSLSINTTPKGKHFISFSYPNVLSLLLWEEIQCISFWVFFYLWFLNGSISDVLNSQFGMQTKRRRKQQQHEKLVLIKSRLNALAAQIRRWIYFSFNGCVHLICCSMPVSRPVHSHTHALCTHKFAYCHEFLRVFSVQRCDCEGSQRKLCKPSRLHWSK